MNEREMQDYIMHYGVKGMRWGHRKDRYYETGRVGDKNYMSSETAWYKNKSIRAKNKANKLRSKASLAKSDKKRQKLLARSNKQSDNSKRFGGYAKKSSALDKRASELFNRDYSKAKTKFGKAMVRLGSTSFYNKEALAEKVSMGKRFVDNLSYGSTGGYTVSRSDYIVADRTSLRKKK